MSAATVFRLTPRELAPMIRESVKDYAVTIRFGATDDKDAHRVRYELERAIEAAFSDPVDRGLSISSAEAMMMTRNWTPDLSRTREFG